jgi:hypothetical protein
MDVFPEFKAGLIGTEYSPIGVLRPQTGNQYKKPPSQFGEVPKTYPKFKNKVPIIPESQTVSTETITSNVVSNQYNPKLHQPIPKSQLEIPLQTVLKATYPEQIAKVRGDLNRYGYFIDPLTDEEHLVLHNPTKKSVIFGVRGTNVMNTNDILTDVESAFVDIKKFDRYKKAEEKYRQVKSKFDEIPIIHASHSLGGLISSVLAQPEDIVYSYNRPYFSYPIKKNEIAISVETDPLLLTRWKNEGTKPVLIPRTYYEKAKDYLAIQKTKVNPDYEEYPIEIPKKYKSDLPDVAYENILKGAFPLAHFAHSIYNKYVSRPEIYRQSLITNLQQQATGTQSRMERISERLTPRTSARLGLSPRATSPRSLERLQQAIQRPFTAIEQNVLNPTILDTTKRAIRQMIRNPSDAFYDVLGHPLLGYAVANYAGGYLSRRASNSHAIENLPLTLRVNTKYIQQ